MPPLRARTAALIARLRRPLDGRQLAWLRVCFGAAMLYEPVAIMLRGDTRIFSDEIDHFSYYGFGWVHALPQSGMQFLFMLLAVSAVGLMTGLLYRLSAIVTAGIWTYVFLIEKTFFLNHWYLLLILAWLFVFVPAGRELSLDNVLFGRKPVTTVPTWALRIFQLQFIIVYFYAGLAKLTPDWLHGRTMRMLLANDQASPLIGGLVRDPHFLQAVAVSGALFDLSIAFLLFWKPARIPALILLVVFHLTNLNLFSVGLFPYIGLVATFILLRPDGVRIFAPWRRAANADATTTEPVAVDAAPRKMPSWLSAAGFTLLGLHVAFQLLFPLRHHLYEGPVTWTGEGYQFAWHMLATSRWVGLAEFRIVNAKTGAQASFSAEDVLIPQQTPDVYLDPDLILQVVDRLERTMASIGMKDVAIYAGIPVSKNGGPFVPFVDPTFDLTTAKRGLGHKPWITDYDAYVATHPDLPVPTI